MFFNNDDDIKMLNRLNNQKRLQNIEKVIVIHKINIIKMITSKQKEQNYIVIAIAVTIIAFMMTKKRIK